MLLPAGAVGLAVAVLAMFALNPFAGDDQTIEDPVLARAEAALDKPNLVSHYRYTWTIFATGEGTDSQLIDQWEYKDRIRTVNFSPKTGRFLDETTYDGKTLYHYENYNNSLYRTSDYEALPALGDLRKFLNDALSEPDREVVSKSRVRVDGKPAYRVVTKLPGDEPKETDTVTTYWIDSKTAYPLRIHSRSFDPGSSFRFREDLDFHLIEQLPPTAKNQRNLSMRPHKRCRRWDELIGTVGNKREYCYERPARPE